MNSFTGTGVAVVTPFSASGEVDEGALERIIGHILEGGADYLVALGTTGETPTLSADEQLRVLDCFARASGGRPFLIGAGGNDTRQVAAKIADLDRRYAPAGFLCVTPYYNKPSQEGLFQHFAACAAATERPLMLYNIPGRSSVNMGAETTLRLASAFPSIRAIKEASGNIEQIMAILAGRPSGFEVLAGDDSLALPVIALGGKGVVSVIGNALPKETSELVQAALAGDLGRARHLHYQLLPLLGLCFQEGNPAGIKAMLEAMGLCSATLRLPLVAASPGLRAQVRQALAQERRAAAN
jgi:4-hydroxy-tetrahydrodipicolinate synthase